MSEDLVSVGKVKVEEIMRTGGGGLDQSGPFSISFRDFLGGVGGLQDDLVGVVTAVVGGVNDSLQEVTLITETNEDVISVSRSTRTLGLPTVTHVLTATGQQDVGTRSVMLVGYFNSTSTVTTESEINDGTIVGNSYQLIYCLSRFMQHLRLVLRPDRRNVTVGTETSNTTIRNVVDTEMGVDSGLLLQDKDIVLSRRQFNLGQDFSPLDISRLSISTDRDNSGINGSSRSLVTSEVVSIDVETLERTRETELDDSPIIQDIFPR